MSISLVTGYAGTAHVTSAEDGCRNAGIFGEGTYILNKGQKLAATATSANTITIADGDIVMQGRHICIAAGTSETVNIANGISGMNRHDLIVLRYSKNTSSGIETVEFAAIQGTSTSGTAGDPSYTAGDILNGATFSEVPIYRVKLNGINIEAVETLVAVQTNLDTARNHIANKNNPHGVTKSQLGLGNVENKSSATIRGELTSSNVTTALGFTPAKTTTATTSANGLMSSADKTKLNGIGTIVSTAPSAVAMSSQSGGTGTAIASIEFPAGIYVVTCAAHFPAYSSSAGSYRRATFSNTSGKIDATRGNSMIAAPINNQTTMIQMTIVLNVVNAATYYLNAQHNSSESLSVSGQIRAVKIA